MPRNDQSYEDRLAEMLAEEILDGADELAREHGGPPDSEQPTSREELDIWGRTDPRVNYDQLLARLMQGGIPPEEAQQLKIVELFPSLAQAFAQPRSPQQADVLARLAERPYRHMTYQHLDPKDRVTYSERMNREWQKAQQAAGMALDRVMGGG